MEGVVQKTICVLLFLVVMVKYNSNVHVERQKVIKAGSANAWILKVATGKRSHVRFASRPLVVKI